MNRSPRALPQNLLVANRGEIASRVFRTARAMGMRTVAVFSDPDADLPFVRDADVAIRLSGSTATETYLDQDAVLEAARRSGADAIHPGFGFLSENPDFAARVIEAGLVWVGPPPAAMAAMALKVPAKRTIAEAGVPLVPGATLEPDTGADAILSAGETVGYPLLVKASAGGGGRGMRLAHEPAQLVDAVEGARREAASAFGDPDVFLERYLSRARHVEVQVFADDHGNVVHLGERECSVQRRHQKIVEEAPSPGITPGLREAMCGAAIAAARHIDYRGAGTVEFMVADDEYYFLEMNTRLQVEHPVTEQVYGVDLVEWQLRVASGEPIPLAQDDIRPSGHAIEVRLYAEDPAQDYLPSTGIVSALQWPDGQVRIESTVETGSTVSPYYDPMIAKVIVHDADRTRAASRLAAALRRITVMGLTTNRDSLVAVLESDDFLDGATTTEFMDNHPELRNPRTPEPVRAAHRMAAVAHVLGHGSLAVPGVPTAWRSTIGGARTGVSLDAEIVNVSRRWDGAWIDESGQSWRLEPQGEHLVVEGPEGVIHCRVERANDVVWVHDGWWSTQWHADPRFPHVGSESGVGGSSAPVPGTVTKISVAAGDAVVAGQQLVVIEAMKMEHEIVAEVDGTVTEVLVSLGQAVEAHALVAEVDPS